MIINKQTSFGHERLIFFIKLHEKYYKYSCLPLVQAEMKSQIMWLFTATNLDSFMETAFGNIRITCGDYVFLLNRNLSKPVLRNKIRVYIYIF